MMLGDIDGAENDCIECLRIDPNNGPGLVLMGNLLTNCKHDDAAAEEYYARAVAADPDSASAHANYGTLLLKRGERMKAIPELRRSIEIDPKQCVAHIKKPAGLIPGKDVFCTSCQGFFVYH